MSQADRIRRYTLENHIGPARARGLETVTIRAGDVHREMRLANALPAVCSAIGGAKFRDLSGVGLKLIAGPANGANVYFTFGLNPGPTLPAIERTAPATRHGSTSVARSMQPDLGGALVLVSCVKSKLAHAAPARQLYTSAWFQKTRDLVEASGRPWLVLSSQYGLVEPNTTIETYDFTLNNLGVAARRAWATKVLAQLSPHLADVDRVVMFAGERYREFLIGPIESRGIAVHVPLASLRLGEQLAWLSEQQ